MAPSIIPTRTLLVLLVALVLMLGGGIFFQALPIRFSVERMILTIAPNAERAYNFGAAHFDSDQPKLHDIDHAEYFFRTAIQLDPNLPYAHHQMARIYFLRGKFAPAIEEINKEIALQGDVNPSAYYVRGLIQGYQGDYENAARDFRYFLTLRPHSWAAANDLSWVLMGGGKYEVAREVLEESLQLHSDNAWLLNSYAIALHETGALEDAYTAALRARLAAYALTPEDWSHANPGNDPRIASDGLETFKAATVRNVDKIASELSKRALE